MRKGRRATLVILALVGVIAAMAVARPALSRGYSNAAMLALYRHAHRAEGAASDGDLARAEALLATALALDAGNAAAHRGRGFVLWQRGARQEAGAEWRRGGIPGADFTRSGRQAQKEGATARAMDWYDRAIATAPEAGEAYVRKAVLHEAAEDWQAALALYEQALAVASFPETWMERQAHLGHANALRKLGRPDDALADYEWLVVNAPYYWGYVRLGELVWKQGDAARAEQLFLQAIAVDPSMKWAYRGLASLYEDTGRLADAEAMFRKVLELDPDDDAARRGLERLARQP
ncbi:MAG: tetratricopeptide repeat protein [Chloroflexi bacterium]|nr:tetratricopeptide repeat protein [Chloroflexota bacterium]